MRKELIAYKDMYGYWTCVFNVLLTEGKNLTDPQSVIEIVKNNYSQVAKGNFVIEETEIFVEVENLDIIINDLYMINSQ